MKRRLILLWCLATQAYCDEIGRSEPNSFFPLFKMQIATKYIQSSVGGGGGGSSQEVGDPRQQELIGDADASNGSNDLELAGLAVYIDGKGIKTVTCRLQRPLVRRKTSVS